MKEFEPYTSFKRIDRPNLGFIDKETLCSF